MSDIYWTEEEDGQEPEPEEDTTFGKAHAPFQELEPLDALETLGGTLEPHSEEEIAQRKVQRSQAVDHILTSSKTPEECLAKVRAYQDEWVKHGVDRVHNHYELSELPIPTVYLEPDENGPDLPPSPKGMFSLLRKFIRVLLG